MYKFEKNIILDERVEDSQPRDIVLVDTQNARIIQNKYHCYYISRRNGYCVFNDTKMVRDIIKLLKLEEEV